MKTLRIPSLLLAAASLLAACDSSTTDPNDLSWGEFEARVTGTYSDDLRGLALSDASPGFDQDFILLTDDATGVEILLIHSDEFGVGREGLMDVRDDQPLDPVLGLVFLNGRTFASTNGTIDLDAVTGAGITGRVSFDAVEANLQTGQTFTDRVSVEASFRTEYQPGSITSRSPAAAPRLPSLRLEKLRVY